MPKSKKRKTHHDNHYPSSSTKKGALSHAEIWDDSALIRSWNDAVAEYEYYHGIHAKGEDVEEVLRQAEAAEAAEAAETQRNKDAGTDDNELNYSDPDEGEIEDGEVNETDQLGNGKSGHTGRDENISPIDDKAHSHQTGRVAVLDGSVSAQTDQVNSTHTKSTLSTIESAAAINSKRTDTAHLDPLQCNQESTVPASAADQTLENIKMAYYWAGYYSGLYDGQRSAQCEGADQGS